VGSTLFNILRQFDMVYAHVKARLGEMAGISHEEGEELMAEGREIVMAFSDYTAKLSKRIRFRRFDAPFADGCGVIWESRLRSLITVAGCTSTERFSRNCASRAGVLKK
jgi:hypothetical protein